ncbi:MAG: preprotein translocase subunit Sec61beta [Candidatus Micrarchaeota archaeon]
MSWKQSKVSMPMASAGILGVSSDERMAGIEVDPKTVVIGSLLIVGIIKLVSFLFKA